MRSIAALAIAVLLVPAARAADESTLYLYASAGAVRTSPGIVQADADALVVAGGATNIESSVNNNDTGFKVLVGWLFAKNFALEAGYAGLGSSRYSATFTDGNAESDFRAGGIVADVLGFLPVGEDFSFYGRVGLIAATVVTSFTMNGPAGAFTHSVGTDTMLKPNYGIGIAYDLSKSAALRFEVERFSQLGTDAIGKKNMDMVSFGFLLKL